ncbi:MAG: hypothetical protein E7379_04040 [Clostridiales bacterium]|nr:hypothetical protein [Clostridiales bacterium]
MNKYENTLSLIGKVLGFSLFCLLAIGFVAAPIIVIFFVGSSLIGGMLLLFEFCLCFSIHLVSYAIGLFFLGDRYKPTGYVSGGQSLDWPVSTYKYVKRNMITNLVEIIACSVFSLVFIFLLCLNLFPTISICGLGASIIGFIIFYLFYKKEQHNLKNKNFEK